MNFYAFTGHGPRAAVLALRLHRAAVNDLTKMFKRLANAIVDSHHVRFDPGARRDPNVIVRISSYELPPVLSLLGSASVAGNLPPVTKSDMIDGPMRAVVGVEWRGDAPRRIVFQRLDAGCVVRRQNRRLMFVDGRFVRDERPGIDITERVDALVEGSTLYVPSWKRAQAVLDLSA